MLMPVAATAECVSTDSITKCAKLPTCFGHCYNSDTDTVANYTNQVSGSDGVSWSYYRDGIPYSGTSANYDNLGLAGVAATCTITSPFSVAFTANAPMGDTSADVCVYTDNWEMSVYDVSITKLDGDTCPDGFFTVPYEETCGTGMVNVTDIPNCADDTSGDFCLMPATVPCALGIGAIKTSTGLSVALYAEKYTTPAINIGYNGGVCYANLEPGQSSGAINISFNGETYHTVE